MISKRYSMYEMPLAFVFGVWVFGIGRALFSGSGATTASNRKAIINS